MRFLKFGLVYLTFELSRQMFENLPELPTSQLLKSQTNQTNGLGATQC